MLNYNSPDFYHYDFLIRELQMLCNFDVYSNDISYQALFASLDIDILFLILIFSIPISCTNDYYFQEFALTCWLEVNMILSILLIQYLFILMDHE